MTLALYCDVITGGLTAFWSNYILIFSPRVRPGLSVINLLHIALAYCALAYCALAYCTLAYCALAYCALAYCAFAYCALAYCARCTERIVLCDCYESLLK